MRVRSKASYSRVTSVCLREISRIIKIGNPWPWTDSPDQAGYRKLEFGSFRHVIFHEKGLQNTLGDGLDHGAIFLIAACAVTHRATCVISWMISSNSFFTAFFSELIPHLAPQMASFPSNFSIHNLLSLLTSPTHCRVAMSSSDLRVAEETKYITLAYLQTALSLRGSLYLLFHNWLLVRYFF
jgi:hypothetical protein